MSGIVCSVRLNIQRSAATSRGPFILYDCESDYLLPPATNLGQGNIFSSLCKEFCMLGYTPPRNRRPLPPSRHPLEQTPQTRHPSRADPPGTRHPPLQSRHPPCTVHAGRYSQQAGGMHPTGMQSCFIDFCCCSMKITHWISWEPKLKRHRFHSAWTREMFKTSLYIHPAGRVLTSADWFVKSFIMGIYETIILVIIWTENSDWTFWKNSHRQPL